MSFDFTSANEYLNAYMKIQKKRKQKKSSRPVLGETVLENSVLKIYFTNVVAEGVIVQIWTIICLFL